MASPEPRSSTALKMSCFVTEKEKNEEETEKHDPPHRTTDNSSCPSSIVLTIGIGAVATSGSNNNAGRLVDRLADRLVLLAEWVSRIEGMRDWAGTGSNGVSKTSEIQVGVAI